MSGPIKTCEHCNGRGHFGDRLGMQCPICRGHGSIRYYSAGPCGNIPAEPARHAHHKARRSEQAGLANSPCPETESS
jgi:DnaJ-class molecular chaperone